MMMQGPWLFRNMVVLMCPYDEFSKTDEIEIVHMPIWLQIHKLPDAYCKQSVVEKLLKDAGEILDMRLNGNTRGDYVRVRVKHDIQRPLTKFVSIVRAKERQVYLVRYEKLARLCKVCGLIGHVFKECGLGMHDEKKMKYDDWLYVDGPNQGRMENHPPKTDMAARPSARHEAPHVKEGENNARQEDLDPALADNASSPRKPADQSHGKEIPPTVVTVEFLDSYYRSIKLAGRFSTEDIIKGKMPISADCSDHMHKVKPPTMPWPAPQPGYVALSIDGSFLDSDGSAAAGMILRDDKGKIIFQRTVISFNAMIRWKRKYTSSCRGWRWLYKILRFRWSFNQIPLKLFQSCLTMAW
ncbi:hypothetical protein D1007_41257 [Hordeum vulgare]|nr:hypothetical protein D1007_41257 [Hordeum vulgare]